MSDKYQVAVIGSGSAGREATLLAARRGLRTALIERDKIGGICFHRGCYAVSALQASARQFRASWSSGRFGNKVSLLQTTLSDWMVAQSKVCTRLADNLEAELHQLNVDVLQGHAEFLDPRTLRIIGFRGSKQIITADNIIVAAGSRPQFYASSIPKMVNSDELLRLTTLPDRLAIIGAGHIGCEFASIYSTLGCEVTLIEKETRVLPTWEAEAGQRVAQAFKERGVKIQVENEVSFAQVEEKQNSVCIRATAKQSIEANLVLVATGRTPNTEGLGLTNVGILDDSFLRVDAKMRLPEPNIYAVGDVNGISMLDSTALSQAQVAVNGIQRREGRFDPRWIPRCVHTEPCLAAVGWTEQEAAAEGIEYLAVSDTIELISDDERSVVEPEPTFLKVIVDSRSRHLLGCVVAGDHAPVIVNTAAIAMRSGFTVEKLHEMPLVRPSASEALMSTLRKLG